ncbi:hypothetical protein [Hafnia alvei]|nr:hypothetical protein [Hafnia alvei]STQ74400.1 Uncharacterised protein [Hafnia alvei]
MADKYNVKATKKDGTTYEGVMTTKEPRLVNGLFAMQNMTAHGHTFSRMS